MASGPIVSWQIDGETMETVTDVIFLGSKITADGDCSHKIKRYLLLGRKTMTNHQFIQLLSRVQFCDPMDCSMPGFPAITNSQILLKLMSLKSVMPPNHFILCHPLIRVFSNDSVLHIRWPKYWIFNLRIRPSNGY